MLGRIRVSGISMPPVYGARWLVVENAYILEWNMKPWKRKLLSWLLPKLGLDIKPYEKQEGYMVKDLRTIYEIDLDSINDLIFQHINSIRRGNHEVCGILMGSKQLMQCSTAFNKQMDSPLQFRIPSDYISEHHTPKEDWYYMGIKVYVVPWFDGIVALPEELFNKYR